MEPIGIILAVVAAGAGFGASQVITRKKIGNAESEAEKQLAKANKEAASIILNSKFKLSLRINYKIFELKQNIFY